MQIYFKNSKSASAMSIIGCLTGVCGLIAFIDLQDIRFSLLAVCGFALLYLGNMFGNKAEFNNWLKAQDQKAIEKKVKASISFAMEKYQECPNKYTCDYISKLNSEAGIYIKKERAESRRKSMLLGNKEK